MQSSYLPILILACVACGGSDGGTLFGPAGSGGTGHAGSSGSVAGGFGGSSEATGGADGMSGAGMGGTGGAAGGAEGVDAGSGGSTGEDAAPGLGGSGGSAGAGGSSEGGNTAAGGAGSGGAGTGGAGGASGLTIRCGSTVCDPKYEACCLYGDTGACVSRQGKCPDKGILLHCDDPSDCDLGEVCCARSRGDVPPEAACAKECSSTGPGTGQPLCDPKALVPCLGFENGVFCDEDSGSIIPSYAYCAH